jgi:hypothetical protein
MHFLTLVLTALAISPALGAKNIEDTVTKFRTLGDKVDNVKRALDSYNGGAIFALPVANAIYNAHQAAEDARKDLGDSDPFDTDEGSQLLDAYHGFHPRLADVLSAGAAKVVLNLYHDSKPIFFNESLPLSAGTAAQEGRFGICFTLNAQQPLYGEE